MELTFVQSGNWYVAEFVATTDFNIHIERGNFGDMYIYQKTIENGEYDIVQNAGRNWERDKVIDMDFVSAVYPKYIRIKSKTAPLLAEVTFSE